MRFFLLENKQYFRIEEIVSKSKINHANCLSELKFLSKVEFLLCKKIKIKKNDSKRKIAIFVWQMNPNFKYINEFENLLINAESIKKEDLLKNISKAGKIKLVITAGIFMDNDNSPADLLIVGDNLNKKIINGILRKIETDIGKELKYSVFSTEDYKYRVAVYDKFVRDILDFPHVKILDKMNEY